MQATRFLVSALITAGMAGLIGLAAWQAASGTASSANAGMAAPAISSFTDANADVQRMERERRAVDRLVLDRMDRERMAAPAAAAAPAAPAAMAAMAGLGVVSANASESNVGRYNANGTLTARANRR